MNVGELTNEKSNFVLNVDLAFKSNGLFHKNLDEFKL